MLGGLRVDSLPLEDCLQPIEQFLGHFTDFITGKVSLKALYPDNTSMFETKDIVRDSEMLMTRIAIFVTNILKRSYEMLANF